MAKESAYSIPRIPTWLGNQRNWILKSNWPRLKIIDLIQRGNGDKWELRKKELRNLRQDIESDTIKYILFEKEEM